MSEVENILKELDENKVQTLVLHEKEQEQKVSVDLVTRKKIIQEFLEGHDKKDIGNKYNISTRAVTMILDSNKDIRHETEIKYQATALARENYRLSETKNKLMDFIDSTIDEAIVDNQGVLTSESKLKVLNNVAALYDKLAITARLNAEKPTQISETRHIKADLGEILKQLPTTDDKLNFLRRQNAPSNINKSIHDGEIISAK